MHTHTGHAGHMPRGRPGRLRRCRQLRRGATRRAASTHRPTTAWYAALYTPTPNPNPTPSPNPNPNPNPNQVETTMLKLDDIDPAFQLWITTEPHPKFPIGLLQMSIKVTNEVRSPPPYHLLVACLLAHLLTYSGSGRCARRAQVVLRLGQPGHVGRGDPAAVEVDALRALFHAHHRAGAAQVWAARLQHTVRVQPVRPGRVRDVHAVPPARHGHQETTR